MSALHQEADIDRLPAQVRSVPTAVIRLAMNAGLDRVQLTRPSARVGFEDCLVRPSYGR